MVSLGNHCNICCCCTVQLVVSRLYIYNVPIQIEADAVCEFTSFSEAMVVIPRVGVVLPISRFPFYDFKRFAIFTRLSCACELCTTVGMAGCHSQRAFPRSKKVSSHLEYGLFHAAVSIRVFGCSNYRVCKHMYFLHDRYQVRPNGHHPFPYFINPEP